MDAKPKYIKNYLDLLVSKVNFSSNLFDINKLIGSYLFERKFYEFTNIFPVPALGPNELIRPNTIVEAYTKSHAICHLIWILNKFYPNCLWLRHKQYKNIRGLLVDKITLW